MINEASGVESAGVYRWTVICHHSHGMTSVSDRLLVYAVTQPEAFAIAIGAFASMRGLNPRRANAVRAWMTDYPEPVIENLTPSTT